MNPTSKGRSMLLWLALGVATFAVLVVGYGVLGLWQMTAPVR
jgi:hypothetical protein